MYIVKILHLWQKIQRLYLGMFCQTEHVYVECMICRYVCTTKQTRGIFVDSRLFFIYVHFLAKNLTAFYYVQYKTNVPNTPATHSTKNRPILLLAIFCMKVTSPRIIWIVCYFFIYF
jgi:hypothetical protein